MVDLFAGRLYGDMVKDNEGVGAMRRLLATRKPKQVEAAPEYSEMA